MNKKIDIIIKTLYYDFLKRKRKFITTIYGTRFIDKDGFSSFARDANEYDYRNFLMKYKAKQ